MPAIFLRSLLYNLVFYVWLVILLIAALPCFLLPRRAIISMAKFWGASSLVLLRAICGARIVYRGIENIPAGPLIVAAKHQSFVETFALLRWFDEPLYILKRELEWIPVFGWFLRKAQMIGIDRASGGRALLKMTKRAGEEVRRGRQLIIFPEGTRRAVGAPPAYKSGVAQLYADCGVPCLPVALNTGLFWPRRTFLRYPGTIVIEFLDVLPAGLSRKEFLARVAEAIETATTRLVEEGVAEQRRLIGEAPALKPADSSDGV